MSTLYAAVADRLLVVRGQRRSHCAQGTQWDLTERLVGHDIECVAASPATPDQVFAGTADAGLQQSADGGETWTRVADPAERVTAVTISPHDPAEVWVGTEPSGVYRSTDRGHTFERREGLTDLPSAGRWSFPPRPDSHHVRWLAVDSADPERVYVAIEAGAFVRTTDAGETWEDRPQDARRDTHTIATHPVDAGRVYAAAGDGYAESTDSGETWVTPQDGLDHRYVWGLAVDPGNPDRVVVSAADGARRAHRESTAKSYVYRREGEEWTAAMAGLPDPEGTIRAVLAAGERAGEFVALTNHGIYRSHDGAKSWERLVVPWREAYTVGQGLAVV